MLKLVVADSFGEFEGSGDATKQRSAAGSAGVKRSVTARSVNQGRYLEAIEKNDMTFGVGPAGTERRIWLWPWRLRR